MASDPGRDCDVAQRSRGSSLLPRRENLLLLALLLAIAAPPVLERIAESGRPGNPFWQTLWRGPGQEFTWTQDRAARTYRLVSWFVYSWSVFVPLVVVALGACGALRARQAAVLLAIWVVFRESLYWPIQAALWWHLGRGPAMSLWHWAPAAVSRMAVPVLLALYPPVATVRSATGCRWGLKLTRAVLIASGVAVLLMVLPPRLRSGAAPSVWRPQLWSLTLAAKIAWPLVVIACGALLFGNKRLRPWCWWTFTAMTLLQWLIVAGVGLYGSLQPTKWRESIRPPLFATVALGALGPVLLAASLTWYWWPVLLAGGKLGEPEWPCCETCGYNLTGNVSGRCPECGTATPRAAATAPPSASAAGSGC